MLPYSGIFPRRPYCAYALVKATAPAPTTSAKTAWVFFGIADTYGLKSTAVSGGHSTLSIFPPSMVNCLMKPPADSQPNA